MGDQDKFDVIAAAEALVMPSPLESLSMVALEAWALGRPVLANGRCDVLVGQCLRSNGGLFYQNGREFEAMLEALLDDPALAARMGHNGRAYYEAEYAWSVIERKYLSMLAHLNATPRSAADPEPTLGWLARRKRIVPPAAAVVGAVPSGPVRASASPSRHTP